MKNKGDSKGRTIVLFGFVSTLIAAISGCMTFGGAKETLDPEIDHRWREDIEVLFHDLPQRHTNLFTEISEEEYRQRVKDLDRRAMEMSAIELDIAIRRLLADVGDAHTNLSYSQASIFPLQFYQFEEGLYVVAAMTGYEEFLTARLVGISGTSVEVFYNTAREIIPHDNRSQLISTAPVYLMLPEITYGLGLTDSVDEITYRLQFPDGTGTAVTVPAVPVDSVSEFVSLDQRLREGGADVPMSRRGGDTVYRFQPVPEHSALYVQYNACRIDESYPMTQFVTDAFAVVETESVQTIIVDVRRNGGGDSRVLEPFIDALVEWRSVDGGEARRLYVVIGRGTFSSAILNAIDLEQRAGAILVGEPSGGRPNHFGEIQALELPVMDRRLTYSTKFFRMYDDGDPEALMPDVSAPVSMGAFVQGRDPAIEAVWERLKSVR